MTVFVAADSSYHTGFFQFVDMLLYGGVGDSQILGKRFSCYIWISIMRTGHYADWHYADWHYADGDVCSPAGWTFFADGDVRAPL